MKIRRLVAASGALVAALALTACGSASPTAGAGFKDVAFTPLTQSNFGSTVSASVKHVRSVHIHLQSSIFNADADFSYGPPMSVGMTMNITAMSQPIAMQMRLVGTMAYVQVPGKTPAGKFMAIDLMKIPQLSPIFKALDQYKKMGPQAIADQFRGGVKTLKYDGTTQIGGVQVRHYTVTIDTSAALRLLGNNAAYAQFAAQMRTMTEQVYLNADHTVRRITMSLPAPVGSMEMDFSNWGEKVTVAAPPASEVVMVSPSQLGAAG